jgi:hypothetical protein
VTAATALAEDPRLATRDLRLDGRDGVNVGRQPKVSDYDTTDDHAIPRLTGRGIGDRHIRVVIEDATPHEAVCSAIAGHGIAPGHSTRLHRDKLRDMILIKAGNYRSASL